MVEGGAGCGEGEEWEEVQEEVHVCFAGWDGKVGREGVIYEAVLDCGLQR